MTIETKMEFLIEITQRDVDEIHEHLDWLFTQDQEHSEDFEATSRQLMYESGKLEGFNTALEKIREE